MRRYDKPSGDPNKDSRHRGEHAFGDAAALRDQATRCAIK
jgi:hypothetical protein